MKWSQLKVRVEACFAECVKGRVELHVARYHKAHDQMGRAWITIDGVEIYNICDFKSGMSVHREASTLRDARGCKDWRVPSQREGYHQAYAEAEVASHKQGIFSRYEFTHSLALYLNLSMDDIAASVNPIVRGMGMLDKRFGKRRIAAAHVEGENPFVRILFALRCEAEGLVPGKV